MCDDYLFVPSSVQKTNEITQFAIINFCKNVVPVVIKRDSLQLQSTMLHSNLLANYTFQFVLCAVQYHKYEIMHAPSLKTIHDIQQRINHFAVEYTCRSYTYLSLISTYAVPYISSNDSSKK